ncbi:hydroxymethylglutaryl-CoA synthase [Candidatus Dojkabacteria bacterium]|nr:hydroxymethylglutaryl-CoA synthase [Candidatus Dojkabacteria bacterium]
MKLKSKSKTGIVSYGTHIPRYRIKMEEISNAWDTNSENYKKGLGLIEKSVPGLDEDTVTLSVNSARQAMQRLNKTINIGAIYVGSESHPYVVKPTATLVGEALEIGHKWTAADLEFACKAGTAALQIVTGLVDSSRIENGMAIGADTAQGAPGDALEYSAAAGGAAFIVGDKDVIARIIHTTSYTSDTPDFWRREHRHFPKHGGRFTGKPAYFKHIKSATKQLLKEAKMQISDFNHVIFHMPNGKFPLVAAKNLGVNKEQLKHGFIVSKLGNTYSACSLLGLAAVLDNANPGEKILVTSYGSGAGSDSIALEVTKNIISYRKNIDKLKFDLDIDEQLNKKIYLTYGEYVRHTEKLIH